MILSRRGAVKATVAFLLLAVLAVAAFVFAYFVSRDGQSVRPSVTVGAILSALALLSIPLNVYADGKAKLVAEGEKFVRQKLCPEKFIEAYNGKINEKNVVCRPDIDVLELLITAYRLGLDRRGEYGAILEMKKLPGRFAAARAMIFEAEYRYAEGDVAEGDKLLEEAIETKPTSSVIHASADIARKTARAMAVRDGNAADYHESVIGRTGVFKADNASRLLSAWDLYQIYSSSNDGEKAKKYLEECASSSGKTAIKSRAGSLIR